MQNRRTILSALLAMPLAGPTVSGISTPWPIQLVRAARAQIGVTTSYDPAYRRLAYPGGDVDTATGVCTDVVIRAYRAAFGFDLQVAIHEDMTSDFSRYPALWGLSRPDRNIDHRRVPNQETFLARAGAEAEPSGWTAGDVITGRLVGSALPHVAILSDRRPHRSHRPLMIHNIGRGTEESDAWPLFEQFRRFRFVPPEHQTA